MISLVLLSMLLLLCFRILTGALDTWNYGRQQSELLHSARFAMERMVRKVRETSWVLLPLRDSDPNDPLYPNQSYYPRTILAVSGGIDNDGDGLVDEDPGDDITGDNAAGIVGIDDDSDGLVDEGNVKKDGEGSGVTDNDAIDGIDNDGDGIVDEDPGQNFYGIQGKKGKDDDGDGAVNEDPLDPLIFYLSGSTLMERQDVLGVTASLIPLAENVAEFQVVRRRVNGNTLIDIHLRLDNGKEHVELNTTVLAFRRISL